MLNNTPTPAHLDCLNYYQFSVMLLRRCFPLSRGGGSSSSTFLLWRASEPAAEPDDDVTSGIPPLTAYACTHRGRGELAQCLHRGSVVMAFSSTPPPHRGDDYQDKQQQQPYDDKNGGHGLPPPPPSSSGGLSPHFWQRLRHRFRERTKKSAHWRDFEQYLRSEKVQQKMREAPLNNNVTDKLQVDTSQTEQTDTDTMSTHQFTEHLEKAMIREQDPWRILRKVRNCTKDQLNFLIQQPAGEVAYVPRPVIMQLLRYMKNPEHRMALLGILCQLRLQELSTTSKAVLLKAIHEERTRLKLTAFAMRAVASIWTSTNNPDLLLLREAVQHAGGSADLHSMLFDKMNKELRTEILQHFAAEHIRFSMQTHSSSSSTVAHTLMTKYHIITDIDDTLQLNWLDKRLPRGTVYPGALQFYNEIRRSSKGRDTQVNGFQRGRKQLHLGISAHKEEETVVDALGPGWWKRLVQASEQHIHKQGGQNGNSLSSDQYIDEYSDISDSYENEVFEDGDPSQETDEQGSEETKHQIESVNSSDRTLSELVASANALQEMTKSATTPSTDHQHTGSTGSKGSTYTPPWYLRWRPRASLSVPELHSFKSFPQHDRPDDEEVGNVFVVTARPSGFSGVIKTHTIRKLEHIGLGNVSVFSGSLRSTAGGIESMGQRKLENMQRLLAIFPEYKFVFVGDSGQADAAVAAISQTYYRQRVTAAFIHDVNPSSATTGDGTRKDTYAAGNVTFFTNYVDAAILARERGLLSEVAVQRVANAAIQDLKELKTHMEAKSPKWHTRYREVVDGVMESVSSIRRERW
eukprot:gb/GECG01002909.1/.p1 GENE.gb/GECG01002909.1/~~gb/GECG01002909.1/.p1  ORF type:complete len:804 (+),score=123.25 gb/GECG01002909.1/:1-2412(+)